MPFQPGNQYGVKAKLWHGALARAIAQDNGQRLRNAAEKVLDLAERGEQWACLMLRDTLDGKPMQQIEAKVDAPASQVDEIEQTRLVHLALKLGLSRLAKDAETVEPAAPTDAG